MVAPIPMIERTTSPDAKINLFKIFILPPLYFPSYKPYIFTTLIFHNPEYSYYSVMGL